jgi:UDP-glucose 4-epimerase
MLTLGRVRRRAELFATLVMGKGFTVLEVIDSVRVTGRPIPVEECERQVGDPAVLVPVPRRLDWSRGGSRSC